MKKNKKVQVAKITVFITSLFIIFMSISYAFVDYVLQGTKEQVIKSGVLSLELDEDANSLTIQNAFPIADEVGMIQTPFTFRLINNGNTPANYQVKLVEIGTGDLPKNLVKYGLTKDGRNSIGLLSNLTDGIIDYGTIGTNPNIIEYELRLWLEEDIKDSSLIYGKSLTYKVDVEISQEIEGLNGPVTDIAFEKSLLGNNCTNYDDGTDTFLVGQCSNNYVWYSGKLWRVVLKNNETGAVKMVTDNAITAIPYNAEGSPTFENSYVDQWLNQEFLPTLHDYEKYLVTDSIWDATLDASNTPARPNGTTTVTRTVGLLNAYEYYTTYAHSDGLANLTTGYLNNNVMWRLLTPFSQSDVRNVGFDGNITYDSPVYGNGARPSVNLKSTIKIDSGTGTRSDPYILEGDVQETAGGTTLLNTRYSGEYIIFNNELYRIVGIEGGLTKITAVDKPSSLLSNEFHSEYGIVKFKSANIKTDLETYYQKLNEETRNMIEPNTTWYLGTVGDGTSYKASICATVDAGVSASVCDKYQDPTQYTTASIALPRIGEMFTSQITRVTKASFWTLTPSSTSEVRLVYTNGNLYSYISFNDLGARPSMYLKSNVVIASNNTGNGTYEKPYSIELGTVSDVVFDDSMLGNNCTTYNDGVDTFLVGQCSNNYVWYSGKLWRVVLKNNSTGAVKMVTDNAITAIPYNAEGNTAFKDSYVDQWLNQEFLPTLHDASEYLVTDYVWDATTDSSSEPARPTGTTKVTRTVGLLNAYEYYTTYAHSSGKATYETGYLNNRLYWWLITPYNDTSHVRIVYYNGTLDYYLPTNGFGVRPSVNLKSTIQIDSGSGRENDPYILKGDQQETVAGTTLLSTRNSGEYITFNNELYRIVGVENGLTKITAVDKPSSLSSNVFHSAEGVTSFTNASIKGDLETYYQGLKATNETAFNMIQPDTTWYLGGVGSGNNYGNYHYKASICVSIDANVSMNACTSKAISTTASIALPRAGEMFTSQITRGTKTSFWTLTPHNDTSNVRNVNLRGNLYYGIPTNENGARPSMYLKSTVKIASNNTGNGTYEKPYSIELGS